MSPLPGPSNQYEFEESTPLDTENVNAFSQSAGGRLDALEDAQQDLGEITEEITEQVRDEIVDGLDPQVSALALAISALNLPLEQVQDLADQLLAGTFPSSAVTFAPSHGLTSANVAAALLEIWDWARVSLNEDDDFAGTMTAALAAKLSTGGGTLTGALNLKTWENLASGAIVDLDTATSNLVNLTGTTTISELGTAPAGTLRIVKHAATLTLQQSANIILPGGVNLVTAAGDVSVWVSEGLNVWRCIAYTRASGLPTINQSHFLIASQTIGGSVTAVTFTALDFSKFRKVIIESLDIGTPSTAAMRLQFTKDNTNWLDGSYIASGSAQSVVNFGSLNDTSATSFAEAELSGLGTSELLRGAFGYIAKSVSTGLAIVSGSSNGTYPLLGAAGPYTGLRINVSSGAINSGKVRVWGVV